MEYLEDDYDLLKILPDDIQLLHYDDKLISLRKEKASFKGRHSRADYEIERDIKDTEFRRKLLLDRMSVKNLAQNQFNNSQVHFGVGDNIGRDKKQNNFSEKWHQKPLGIIILGIIASAAVSLLFYFF